MPEGVDDTIRVRINEREASVSRGTTIHAIRQSFKPEADVVIRNGFPVSTGALDSEEKSSLEIRDGDEIVLIRRGEMPGPEEMEALLVARHGPGVHERVKQARVGIAGCGGLGSAVAIALTRTGIGSLLLVDFDVVEPSNLNRQQFFVDQIGQPKVEALAENLSRMNPYVTIETRRQRLTRATIPEVFAGCDAIAECFDDPAMKRDMSLAVRLHLPETPLVTVSGLAGFGPANQIRSRRIFKNIFLVGDTETAARPGCGLLAPRVAVAAGHQANLVLRLLLGEITETDEG